VNAPIQAEDFLRPRRYEIQRLLRSTRDKSVYLARDRELDCLVALDVFANNARMPTGMTVSAWETRVLGKLGDHRNIATVLDHWEDDQTAVMVTRYLSGGSLHDLIVRRSSLSIPIQHASTSWMRRVVRRRCRKPSSTSGWS
jgi:serine/threonine protein kinase